MTETLSVAAKAAPSQDMAVPGAVVWLSPLIRRVLAPNPSAMTGPGTNSYLLGAGGDLLLIDPGPADDIHARALLAALAPDERITAIVVTHAHLDHSALARPLAQDTGAPVLAFGPADAGRSEVMAGLMAGDAALGDRGEGVDHGFAPDRRLAEGDRLAFSGGEVRVLHTPGHMANHICLAHEDSLFSGDHVMGWSTTLVSPPDGDMGAYMEQLARLARSPWGCFLPGHGAPVADPAARIATLIAHRRAREAAILDLLAQGPQRPGAIVARLYAETPPQLHPAALRNVLAHLIDLCARGYLAADPGPAPGALYRLSGSPVG